MPPLPCATSAHTAAASSASVAPNARDAFTAYVALGSNLGDSINVMKRASDLIETLDGVTRVKRSSLYRSQAIGTWVAQPDYLNAVLQVETTLPCAVFWQSLAAIEASLGRVRTRERNAARTIDIDLLLYGDVELATDALTVPHPRLTTRAFVVFPLLELAPDIKIPGKGSLQHFTTTVASQIISRLEGRAQWT